MARGFSSSLSAKLNRALYSLSAVEASSEESPLTGDLTGRTIAQYRVTAKLGEGGMGEVYRATDTKLKRDVAIKVLPTEFTDDEERRARFEREAQLLAQLHHPNIAAIFGLEDWDGVRAIVMELVEGPTLAERLAAGFLPVTECLSIARQIAEALEEAHGKGIVHRDLKPQNIKVTRAGKVKVLDFGLAKRHATTTGSLLDEATTQSLGTRAGTLLGTVGYMAPEQVRGEEVDGRADIFAFGCVLYEMLTGRRAFERPTAIETLSAILHEEPVSVSRSRRDLPPSADRLLAHCLEKDRARRFASGRELVEQFAAIRGESGAEDADVPSLAVLPFADMSPEHNQEYFCEGIAEELLNSLARIRGLRVASRTSSFQFKGLAADTREIGERLGVRAILDGSVRKAATRLRITVQLVDPRNGYQLWSERYDRELVDVFEIQDDIARRIVEALEVRLLSGEFRGRRGGGARDANAFDLYLRGMNFFYRGTRRDFEFAQELFRKAIELDGRYASPWAGIADCNSQIFREFDRRAQYLEEARTAAARALELDPESAPAHASFGFALSLADQRAAAEEAFQKALQLDPRLFEACYLYASEMLYGWGDLERAAALFERASEVDRNDYQSPIILASVYLGLGRRTDALAAATRGVQIARAQLQLNPGDLRALYMSAQALAVVGEDQHASELARRARELDGDRTGLVLINVAEALAMLGKRDEAIACLALGVARGFRRETAIRFDPFLATLRDDSRFLGLLDRMRRESNLEPPLSQE
jgi:serine/threonine protein kinase/tetratricopeptide (TPR) repeat protein